MAGWEQPLPDGEGRGIAVTKCFGSIVAEVAHVTVSAEGRLRVNHVYAAVDCGESTPGTFSPVRFPPSP